MLETISSQKLDSVIPPIIPKDPKTTITLLKTELLKNSNVWDYNFKK